MKKPAATTPPAQKTSSSGGPAFPNGSSTVPEPVGKPNHSADLEALPSDWRLVQVGPNKAPIAGDGWFDVDDFSPDEALALNGDSPPAWGLKTGPASGVLVLDLDAEGWEKSFEAETGHTFSDLPLTIGWTSGKPGRSGHAFQVDSEWWPSLRNRKPFTRPWREGDPLGKNGSKPAVTLWELRGDRHQAVIMGAHPETSGYRWLEGQSPHEISDPAPAPAWLLQCLLVQEDPDATPWAPSGEDSERAVAMLQCLPPEQFTARDNWLQIGMALHHTDPGLLSAWVDWCRPMYNFDEAECSQTWQSFGKGYKGRPVTLGTLDHLAKQHGYEELRKRQQTGELPPPPFRVLGWGAKLDAVWIQTGEAGIVASVPLSVAGLQRIASLSYWEGEFPDGRRVNWAGAISSIRDQAESLGTFAPDRIRGRGVWLDQNRVVWHLGNRLEVDGQPRALTELRDSVHTYAALPALDINPEVEPLSDAMGGEILELFHRDMQWVNDGDGLLALGHTVLGNVCAALEIRPGLQITGSSGDGKTTTQGRLIRPLQADLAMRTSAATEAGVRQEMGYDAVPAVIDESEQENARKREGHLNLLRLSFDGLKQVKGTPGGQAHTFTMRSMITLIGINASVPNPADRNRMVIIQPRKMGRDAWTQFQLKRDRLITIEAGQRLVRRTVSNLPALLENIQTFTAAVANDPGSDRTHQVVGSLLAGAHHLTSTEAISIENARSWLEKMGWRGLDEETIEATSSQAEAKQCLEYLLGHLVAWKTSSTNKVSIRELLQVVKGKPLIPNEPWLGEEEKGDAIQALGRLGIKWDQERGLLVANSCRVFSDSKWDHGNHKNHLLNLDIAAKVPSTIWFGPLGGHKAISLRVQIDEQPPDGEPAAAGGEGADSRGRPICCSWSSF